MALLTLCTVLYRGRTGLLGLETKPSPDHNWPRYTTHLQSIGPHGAKVSLKAWLSLVEKDGEVLLGKGVSGVEQWMFSGQKGHRAS